MSGRLSCCFNSVLCLVGGDTASTAAGREIMRGTHAFSYCWDLHTGHFPHMMSLAESNGMVILGFGLDKCDVPESCSHLKSEQLEAFGPAHQLINVNEVLSKPVLELREIFKYFVINQVFTLDQVLGAGGFPNDPPVLSFPPFPSSLLSASTPPSLPSHTSDHCDLPQRPRESS